MNEQRLVNLLVEFARRQGFGWEGTATELRAALGDDRLPPTPRFGRALRGLVGYLAAEGVTLRFTRTPQERTVHLRHRDAEPAPDYAAEARLQAERAARERHQPAPEPSPAIAALRRNMGRW